MALLYLSEIFRSAEIVAISLESGSFFQFYIVRTSRSRWSEHFLSKVDKIETKLVVFNTALLVLSLIKIDLELAKI